MTTADEKLFKENYQKHLQHLKLKGLQPKTIDAYARAIRRIGGYFKHEPSGLLLYQLEFTNNDTMVDPSYADQKFRCLIFR
ncbi:MAG: hypothetical protein AUJ56_04760 [Zetaproteobacteria bacterium CG1_02_49_23]|nr:MAG: hypothetical protein AUJ56_04760 [Zetaproteobacteria bacterium CG1_02_49_23]